MENESIPKVFVIIPFDENFLALYDELKRFFHGKFEFANAGDLDNQQNVLKDIVEGICQASVIIADLTGLNANVFYELGLAHAMNKKVIIITQDIGELPFDIKSYRANEYSLQFNKLPKLMTELEKLLLGAVDDSVKYGNPVSDYKPDFYSARKNLTQTTGSNVSAEINDISGIVLLEEEHESEKGFLDFIADIEENTEKMTRELASIIDETNEMKADIKQSTDEINRVKAQSGNVDVTFVRNVCRKLSEPVDSFAEKLKIHVNEVVLYWNKIENDYLSLLDTSYAKQAENSEGLKKSMKALRGVQSGISEGDKGIEKFANAIHGGMGMERKLNRAFVVLVSELGSYRSMMEKISSSIDRIISKSDVIMGRVEQ